MKSVEKIWAELSAKVSTELSEVKVELSIVNEIKSQSSEANSKYEVAVKSTFAAIKEIDSAIQTMETVIRTSRDAVIKGEQVERAADELGIQLDSSVVKAIQDAFNVQQAAEQNLKDLNKAKQAIL
jgi:hypothetical protein